MLLCTAVLEVGHAWRHTLHLGCEDKKMRRNPRSPWLDSKCKTSQGCISAPCVAQTASENAAKGTRELKWGTTSDELKHEMSHTDLEHHYFKITRVSGPRERGLEKWEIQGRLGQTHKWGQLCNFHPRSCLPWWKWNDQRSIHRKTGVPSNIYRRFGIIFMYTWHPEYHPEWCSRARVGVAVSYQVNEKDTWLSSLRLKRKYVNPKGDFFLFSIIHFTNIARSC